MAITAINSVGVDRDEYSKYYHFPPGGVDYGTITIVASATGDDGDVLYFTLVNKDNSRPIVTVATTLAGGLASASIDLRKDAYDLDGIYRARQGMYYILAATLPDMLGLTKKSAYFAIMAASSAELQNVYLRGIPLIDERTFTPEVQGLAGVTGLYTRDVQRGGYALAWDATARTLSWHNGPPIIVPPTGAAYEATLWADTLDQTATFSISPSTLPGTNVNAYLMVDYGKFDGSVLRNHLNNAYNEVAGMADVPLEPFMLTTSAYKAQFPYADGTNMMAVQYRPYRYASRTFRLQLPVRRVIKIHDFAGYHGTNKAVTMPLSMLGIDGMNGIIEVLPSINTHYPAPTAVGMMGIPMYGMAYPGLPAIVPQFWHMAITYGIDDLDRDPAASVARESILRIAAINILGLVGRARVDILSGESFSRDGANLSRQYTSGQWGVYSDLIQMHMQWLQENAQRLRDKLVGREVAVAGS